MKRGRAQKTADTLPVSALVGMGAPWNPRKIDPDEMERLKNGLKFFGCVQSIVVNTRSQRIVGGHQRVAAAQALGWKELPVTYVDLDEPSEKQLNVSLNRLGGSWDDEKLAELLRGLQAAGADMALTGFTQDEINEYLGQIDPKTVEEAEPGPPPKDPVTKPGDLILMGEHRLLCGDARLAADTQRLMSGDKAVCMWTDPPYGVSYVGKTKDALTIENDEADGDLDALLAQAFAQATVACASGAAFYVARPGGANALVFTAAVFNAGWRLHQELVWAKDTMVLGRSDYHYQHEVVMYGWMEGGGRRGRGTEFWYGDNSQKTVFNIPKPSRSEMHPTMKPVALVAAQLSNSTKGGDIVYDPFSGSGSTLMACEQLGRVCYGLELDPTYADVIVTRWEALTGGKAERR